MTQLTLFGDDSFNDDRPLPEIVADRWNFPLAVGTVQEHAQSVYAIQDWIAGIAEIDTTKASNLWQKMRGQTVISIHGLPYQAKDGRVYDRDYTDDRGLYLIAQNLRQLKSRARLAQIKDFLADAGVFADEARRNPEKAAQQLQDYSDRREYKRLIAGGWTHDAAVQWLDTRDKQRTRRNSITASWQARGAKGSDYATLTNTVTEVATGKTATQHKRDLAVANPRDHLSAAENAKIAGVELFSGILHTTHDSRGVDALKSDIEESTQFLNFEAIDRLMSKKRPGDVA